MKVVANGIVLNKVKTLDIFQLDLGMSLADPKTSELVITDTFIYKYFTLTGKQI